MSFLNPIVTFLNRGGQLKLIGFILGLSWIGTLLLFLFPDVIFYGALFPRETFGLFGIITGPLLHYGLLHILANSVSFLILGAVVSAELQGRFPRFLLVAYLFNGALLWVFGRASFHLGLSGVIFSLLGFLLMNSVVSKQGSILGLLLVLGIFVSDIIKDGFALGSIQSWEGHLVGLFVGVCLAVVLKKRVI